MSLSESSIITLSDSESEDPKVYTIDESDVIDESIIEVVTLDDSNANQSAVSCAVDDLGFIPVPDVFDECGAVLRRGRKRPFGVFPDVICVEKCKQLTSQNISGQKNLRSGKSGCEKLKVAGQRVESAKKSRVTCRGEESASKLKVTCGGKKSATKLSITSRGEGSASKLKVTCRGKKCATKLSVTSRGEGSPMKLRSDKLAMKLRVASRGEESARKLRSDKLATKLRDASRGKKSKVVGEREESAKMVTSKLRHKCGYARNVAKPKITRIQLSHTNIHAITDAIQPARGLRPVVLDGCNVAFGFGKGNFEIEGIISMVEYFKKRGHQEIVCFLPQYYQNKPRPERISKRIRELEAEDIIVYTPSRVMDNGQQIKPYDDRFIVQYASAREGVVVSNDNYKDLINEEPSWRVTIERRIINFTFARGLLMLPKDPLGPNGPTLDEMLRFPST